MDNFIICNKNKYLYCDYIAYYNLHPNFSFKAKRISPFYIFSEEYGYMKAFDENLMQSLIVEENAQKSFEFRIKIIYKNGGHVLMDNFDNSPYIYTLPLNSEIKIINKEYDNYETSYGGWLNKYLYQKKPIKKRITIFTFENNFKPFLVIISNKNNSYLIDNNDEKKILNYKSIHLIYKKGFVDDLFILESENGKIPYKDTTLIGYYNIDKINHLNSNNCVLCTNNPINTSIIHGDFAHSFCCFDCSNKLFSSTCPICRLPIDKIVLNYLSI